MPRTNFFSVLMQNPAGSKGGFCRDCLELYYPCLPDPQDDPCCSGGCIADSYFGIGHACCPEGTGLEYADCIDDAQCCGPDAVCDDYECSVTAACFAGSTMVRTLESSTPTPLQEVKTGDHIQCADTAGDSLQPGKIEWCEVFNWVESDPISYHQYKVTFRRPDGTSGTLTVSPNHMMLITGRRPAKRGGGAASAEQGHKTLKASTVQVGDTLAFAGAADSAQVASTVTVTAVKRVKARGAYIPAIAKPFMVAEGVVVPLLTVHRIPVETHGKIDTQTAQLKLIHGGITPLIGQYLQPKGTRGVDAVWGPKGERNWPGTEPLRKLLREQVKANKVVDYARVERFMVMKRAAAKVGLAAVTAEDALALYKTVWVDGPAPIPKEPDA